MNRRLTLLVVACALSFAMACADLQPLKDHIAELDAQQTRTQSLVQRLVTRLAAALVQVEQARKELARLAAAEGH